MKRAVLATAVLAAAVLTALLTAVPTAQAADYRYWTYWSGSPGGWTFSQVGPGSAVPADGSVEGWRFAISVGTRGQGAQPRIQPGAAFQQFCGATAATRGKKRVAVVFDFGTGAEAPDGQSPPQPRGVCVVTAPSATGATVLTQGATVRSEAGLVCGIGGYPTGECAPAITSQRPTPSPKPTRRTPARNGAAPQSDPGATKTHDPTPDAQPPARPAPVSPRDSSTASSESAGRTGNTSAQADTKGDADSRAKGSAPTSAPRDASVAPAAPGSAEPSPGPTFISAPATVPTQSQPWWPLALTAGLVAAAAGYLGWRRRSR